MKGSILLFGLFVSTLQFTCVNEEGTKVDWFIAMRLNPDKDPRVYAIIDSTNSKKWRKTDETSIFKKLFDPISPLADGVIAWNDSPGNDLDHASQTTAHSKGLIAGAKESENRKTGFILHHSIPKFPNIYDDNIDPVSMKSSSYG